MNNENITNIIQDALKKGCRFVSFTYRTKGSGELARHTVALGVNLERVYRRDRNIVSGKLAHLTGIHAEAGREILSSLNDSLQLGIGNNPRFTGKGHFTSLGKGMKIHNESGELEIFGFKMKKQIMEPGVHKEVKSKPMTLAKQEIKKSLKSDKFRMFSLSGIRAARINGDILILDIEN